MAPRMAARSTTAGTPVKSCRITRAGMKGSSTSSGAGAFQPDSRFTSSSPTSSSSTLRSTDSSSTLMENGSCCSPGANPTRPRASNR